MKTKPTALVYKTNLISTIVDQKTRLFFSFVYKTNLISTIVDFVGENSSYYSL